MCKSQQHLLECLTQPFLILKKSKANKASSYSQKFFNIRSLSQTFISIALSLIFFSVLPISVESAYLWLTALQNSVYPRIKDENFWGFIIWTKMLIFICIWMHWNYVQNRLVKPPGNKLGPWQWTVLEVLACLVLPTWWHCKGIWDEMVAISSMAFPHYGELLGFYKKKTDSKPFSLYQVPFLGLQKSLGLQPSSTFQYRYNQNGRHRQRWVIWKHHCYRTSFQTKLIAASRLLLLATFYYLNLCLLGQISIKFRDGYNISTISPSQLKWTPIYESEHWVLKSQQCNIKLSLDSIFSPECSSSWYFPFGQNW